ncbi:MAG: cell division protein ZapD [Betaproteobacteria bacterium]|nr:cell division protein ZapD [Betaproteobacteria bacterium]
MIAYNYPLNAQIRMLLKLTSLFDRLYFFVNQESSYNHHAALMTLFEILDITVRDDIKSDLLMALERQRQVLLSLRNNPKVEQEPLEKTLAELELAVFNCQQTKGKFGEHLRNHEWLMSVKQRASIPGGLCDFDAPPYHYWLTQQPDERRLEILSWLEPMESTWRAMQVQLSLLKDSGKEQDLLAVKGAFQQARVGAEAKLLRVQLDESLACTPEISANKYMLNIRFLQLGVNTRGNVCNADIPFKLITCSF